MAYECILERNTYIISKVNNFIIFCRYDQLFVKEESRKIWTNDFKYCSTRKAYLDFFESSDI